MNQDIKTTINLILEKTSQEKALGKGPYTSFFRDCIVTANNNGASDIHIEPNEKGVDIRLRVNGDLVMWKQLPKDRRESLVYEIKRLTNLSIETNNKPLDARVSLPARHLNIRANSLPTIYGEKIVLRLLRTDRDFQLQKCGFKEDMVNVLRDAIREPNGVIIISGPTGSGKTSTLYALLQELNSHERNIVTLEDPVEYTLYGMNQVEITKELKFADGLRSILRQDPDVILVGEIRDEETALMAFKAASTGHLVFSTIHANGAVEVIDRLTVLGIDQGMIKSNLRLSMAQRLAKLLCSYCSKPPAPEKLDLVIQKALTRNIEIEPDRLQLVERNLTGCPQCTSAEGISNPGIVGRQPIGEFVDREALSKGDGVCAKRSLFQSYLELSYDFPVDVHQVI